MSDLSQTATADASTSDHLPHPLVNGLRQRHAKLSTRDSRARSFELSLPDRTTHAIGDGGEPAFSVRIGRFSPGPGWPRATWFWQP